MAPPSHLSEPPANPARFTNERSEAIRQLRKALDLNPLLQPAIETLAKLYRNEGQPEKASELLAQYDQTMHISRH